MIRKRIGRSKMLEFFGGLSPCLVGLEACPSAHYWGRELQALGHTVKLMPPSYVKAYLKRSKNDANDAAAICEAVTRPSMRFVPIKTKEQQTALMLHRTRQLLVRQRTMLSNALRGHMAELGIVAAKGRDGTGELFRIIADVADNRLPQAFPAVSMCWRANIAPSGRDRIHRQEHPGLASIMRSEPTAGGDTGHWSDRRYCPGCRDRRLEGVLSGRSLAAWIGLVPKRHSTGGKERLGSITKQGNRYLRWLLVAGAMAVIRYARSTATKNDRGSHE